LIRSTKDVNKVFFFLDCKVEISTNLREEGPRIVEEREGSGSGEVGGVCCGLLIEEDFGDFKEEEVEEEREESTII
jgi:hypothetical protein